VRRPPDLRKCCCLTPVPVCFGTYSAARIARSTQWRIVYRYLLPNAFGVIVVNVTFNIADAILAVAYLGFLGLGLHYPSYHRDDLLFTGTQHMMDGDWWQI
jgi:ABC-type dipeptide/oligopeptide/nickel transport system permease subunit